MYKIDEIFIVNNRRAENWELKQTFIKKENAENYAELIDGYITSYKVSDTLDSHGELLEMKKIYELSIHLYFDDYCEVETYVNIIPMIVYDLEDWKNWKSEYYYDTDEFIQTFYIENEEYDSNYYQSVVKETFNKIKEKIANENYNEDMINKWLKTIE